MGISRHFHLLSLFPVLALLLVGSGCSEPTEPSGPLVIAPDLLPPREVPFVRAGHGPEPGEAEVSWRIVPWSTYTIKEYQVAASFSGPVTQDTWDQALILGRYRWGPGQVEYHVVFGANDGLTQGSGCWFAVRACDERDNLSPLSESPRLNLSFEWWIEGQVRGIAGYPVGEMRVTSQWPVRSTMTDEDGSFRVGPFRSIDPIVLGTGEYPSGDPDENWYGFTLGPLRTAPGLNVLTGQDFFLIPRYLKDPRCPNPDNTFLSYLRILTRTTGRDGNPASTILHRWEHYPLSVFIPAAVNDDGVLMDEAAQDALDIWNFAMGEEYFSRTDDPMAAEIEFTFEDREHHYGSAFLLAPLGPGVDLGEVIPTKMGVSIDTKLTSRRYVTEISLHELGHTLGMINHSDCPGVGYLMEIAGGFGSLSRPEPIHLDERRAVECIRYLPQGQNMAGYW